MTRADVGEHSFAGPVPVHGASQYLVQADALAEHWAQRGEYGRAPVSPLPASRHLRSTRFARTISEEL
ncbi:hypothetical protein OG949_37475 [Streptomyces scopuliridis]|uniref:hypothetical protein n=1 Tax=Streptomyces scopuliridis TaxID=452529 RepID=UPI0004BF5699|nr:hypothetical protein [Streptomyces scopuliridis]WSB37962.1 hypothetical protein OG949_37475 [Streptomyces scopuliridis]